MTRIKKRASVYSLGCKVNFVEGEDIKLQLRNFGYDIVDFGQEAELIVINSCTVTKEAQRKTLKALRRAKRAFPNATVVLAGCLPQVYGCFKEADICLGSFEKADLPSSLRILSQSGEKFLARNVFAESAFFPKFGFLREFGTRAFLKIEQGCTNFCSFCVVPFAKGKVVSLEPQLVEEAVKRLRDLGTVEIVLTATNLSSYGKDISLSLLKLLERLEKIDGVIFRLSSVTPQFDESLLTFLVSSERIAPHFHLSVQSASGNVLKAMNRRYSEDELEKVVETLRKKKDVCIGADLIAGFANETEKDFEKSLSFLRKNLDYAHVFPFSAMPKTKAFSFKRLPKKVVRERAEILRKEARKRSLAFRRKFLGRTLKAVPISARRALTLNYINVFLKESVKDNCRNLIDIILEEVKEKKTENYGRAKCSGET